MIIFTAKTIETIRPIVDVLPDYATWEYTMDQWDIPLEDRLIRVQTLYSQSLGGIVMLLGVYGPLSRVYDVIAMRELKYLVGLKKSLEEHGRCTIL